MRMKMGRNTARAGRPLLGFFGATTFSALGITIGLWAEFAWIFLPLIWLLTALTAGCLGLPLYALAARLGWVNGWSAAMGGAAAALAPAASILLSGSSAASTHTIAAIVAFGWCGAASGLLFLLILHWPLRSHRIGSAVVATSAIAFTAAWIAQDHSCHNPVWYGRGIAQTASFRVLLPFASWRDTVAETERFGRAAGWSIRREQIPTAAQPWLRLSVCRADGTKIEVNGSSDESEFSVGVYQPQGGSSWLAPMRALHARLHARWPAYISYRDRLGEPTPQTPAWLAPKVTPAPSATVR